MATPIGGGVTDARDGAWASSEIDAMKCLWVYSRCAIASPGVWIVYVERGIADAGVSQQEVFILGYDRAREEPGEVTNQIASRQLF